MNDNTGEPLSHVLFVVLFIARMADVGTTYAVSPRLLLEANPLVRRWRWPFAIFTIAASLLAYCDQPMAVVFIIVSFMVAASNARGIWMSRTLGEAAYLELMLDLIARSRLSLALVSGLLPGLLIACAGGVTFLFYRRPTVEWGWWLGAGIVSYGLIDAFYRSLGVVRLWRMARVRGPSS